MKNTLLLLFLLPLLSFGQTNQGWTTGEIGNTFDGRQNVAYALDRNEDYILIFRVSTEGDAELGIGCVESWNQNIEDANAILFAIDKGEIYHFSHRSKDRI